MRAFVVVFLSLLLSSAASTQPPSTLRSSVQAGAGFGQQASLREWSSVGVTSTGAATSGRFALTSGTVLPLRKKLSSVIPPVTNLPGTFQLYQNYPNPFNPATVVGYQVPVASNVKLIVYDNLGREVAVLENGRKEAGTHQVQFNGAGLASGVYFYRLQVRPLDFPLSGIPPGAGFGESGTAVGRDSKSGAGDFVQTKKLLLLR